MRSSVTLLVVGLLALMLQGALARMLPPPWCPDLAWLVVVALGLRWPGFISGLVLVGLLGFATDLVSGSLMGQHALMRVLTYLAAALAARHGLAIVATLSFFVGSAGIGLHVLGEAFVHALVNALVATPALVGVERLIARLSDDELGRRGLPLGLQRGSV
jgi:cell shape-determining protein MreD